LNEQQQEDFMTRIKSVLNTQAARKELLTYLELADRVAMPGPQRIHRITRLLEKLMKEDVAEGRPIRSAIVLSRIGHGLPAEGFFDRARRLRIFENDDRRSFHRRQVEAVFSQAEQAPVTETGNDKSDSLPRLFCEDGSS
jgi:hypothetical protein